MAEYGISYSACKRFKSRHLPEIERRMALLQLGIHDRASQLWVNDQVELQELRQHLIEDNLHRREEPDLPARDVSRYNRDIDQLLYKASELAGLIKQRTQAEVEVTSTIPLGSRLVRTEDGRFHEVEVTE